MNLKEAFFKDLANHLQVWRDDLIKGIADPAMAKSWAETAPAFERLHSKLRTPQDLEDLRSVLDEAFRGILHSTLVTIDGGTEASEIGNLALIDTAGNEPLTTGALHEEFVEYLVAHGLA